MGTETHRHRDGDAMVEVTVTIRPAVIAFADIVAAAEVREDGEMGMPWEEHDGWEHEAIAAADWPYRGMDPLFNPDDVVRDGYRDARLIRVGRDQAREWGVYERYPGESAQVAYERGERARRRALDQIKTWYRDGCIWYFVAIRFLDQYESLGGIQTDGDSPDDPYLAEVADELAREVADKLEAAGYTVTGQPERGGPVRGRAAYDALIWNRRVGPFQFARPEDYHAWRRRVAPLPEPGP